MVATAVGYSGGHKPKPTYVEVSGGNTGHAEAVLVEFDPKKVSYESLLDIFWKAHDPTTKDRQGPDVGSQYRSAVFYRNADQQRVAEAVRDKLNAKRFGGKILTQIAPASTFWMAEEYHQQYNEKRGMAGCPIRR